MNRLYRTVAAAAMVLMIYAAPVSAAAPVWQTADQQTGASTTSPISVNKPTNLAENDLIVCAVFVHGGLTPSVDAADIDISGFQEWFQGSASAAQPRAIWYTKTATGSEPSTYSVAWTDDDGAGGVKVVCGRVTGWNTSQTLVVAGNQSGSAGNGTPLTITGQTTSVNEVLRLVGCAWRASVTITASGFTSLSSSATSVSYFLGYEALGAAGAQSNVACDTASGTGAAVGNTLYIEPTVSATAKGSLMLMGTGN